MVVILPSRCFNNAAFGVLIMEPSTWLTDNGTGVGGYFRTAAMSTFDCKDKYNMLPNISLTMLTSIILLSFELTLREVPSDANVFVFTQGILCSNLSGFSTHSSLNFSCNCGPLISTSKRNFSTSTDTALTVPILNRALLFKLLSNGFIVSFTISFTFFRLLLLLCILLFLKSDVTSSFLFNEKSSNIFETEDIRRKWLSIHLPSGNRICQCRYTFPLACSICVNSLLKRKVNGQTRESFTRSFQRKQALLEFRTYLLVCFINL